MGGVAYDDRVDAPFGYDPTYHPLAGLNVPPGSVRLRRMSMFGLFFFDDSQANGTLDILQALPCSTPSKRVPIED